MVLKAYVLLVGVLYAVESLFAEPEVFHEHFPFISVSSWKRGYQQRVQTETDSIQLY